MRPARLAPELELVEELPPRLSSSRERSRAWRLPLAQDSSPRHSAMRFAGPSGEPPRARPERIPSRMLLRREGRDSASSPAELARQE